MKPRRTPQSNTVYRLKGGNEDNDLWTEVGMGPGDQPVTISEWEFSPAEREAIAVGGRVQLVIHSHILPPVSMLAVLRGTSGDLYVIEPGDRASGAAVLLPAQAERLRRWLRISHGLVLEQVEGMEAMKDANPELLAEAKLAVAEIADLIRELKPLGSSDNGEAA